MLIDCDSCAMRDIACTDCVVTMLLDGSGRPELDDDECRAVDLLSGVGLVAPLRLIPMLDTGRRPSTGKRSIA
jgi:hypothetical protein